MAQGNSQLTDNSQASTSPYASILIQYKKAIPDAERQRILKEASVTLVKEIRESYSNIDVVKPDQPGIAAAQTAVIKLKRNPSIRVAEIQTVYSHESSRQ
jgi:hypothetical protein